MVRRMVREDGITYEDLRLDGGSHAGEIEKEGAIRV